MLLVRLWFLQVIGGEQYAGAGRRQPPAHRRHPGPARQHPRPQRRPAGQQPGRREPGGAARSDLRGAAARGGADPPRAASSTPRSAALAGQECARRGDNRPARAGGAGRRTSTPDAAATSPSAAASSPASRSSRPTCAPTRRATLRGPRPRLRRARSARRDRRLPPAGLRGDETVGRAASSSQYEQYLRGDAGRRRGRGRRRRRARGPRAYISSRAPVARATTSRCRSTCPPRRRWRTSARRASALTGADGAAGVALDPAHRRGPGPGLVPDLLDPRSSSTAQAEADRQRSTPTRTRPLLDRAIPGRYPAGSTFKPITAVAGAQGTGVPHARPSSIDSPSEITLYKQRFQNFRTTLTATSRCRTALEVSSDTFFYQVGRRASGAGDKGNGYPLQDRGARLRPGQRRPASTCPGEAAGLVPDPAWKKQQLPGPDYTDFERSWLAGDTIQLAVGQGYLQVDPAPDGRRLRAPSPTAAPCARPPSAREVLDPNGARGAGALAGAARRASSTIAGRRPRRRSGRASTRPPTAPTAPRPACSAACPSGDKVAGKTGTAETGDGGQDHSWFVGYAPYDDPKIVVAIVIERGGTGANAAAPAVPASTIARVPQVRRATAAATAARRRADDARSPRRAAAPPVPDRVRVGRRRPRLDPAARASRPSRPSASSWSGRPPRTTSRATRATTSTARSSSSRSASVLMVVAHPAQPRPAGALGLGPVGRPARRAGGGVRRRAPRVKGSNRWIDIGPFNLQPSEIGKVVIAIVLAGIAIERMAATWARARFTLFLSGVAARARRPSSSLQPDLGTVAGLRAPSWRRSSSWSACPGRTSRCAGSVLAIVILARALGAAQRRRARCSRTTRWSGSRRSSAPARHQRRRLPARPEQDGHRLGRRAGQGPRRGHPGDQRLPARAPHRLHLRRDGRDVRLRRRGGC